jgi:hypothetical protein
MSKTELNLTSLKQYLKTRSHEELVTDISELFKKFELVKAYYQIKLYPEDETAVISKYKKIIENEFFPSRGYGKAKLAVAKKAITDYKRVSENPVNIADIMIFYVEQGVKFTKAYGDIDENFYISMENMYEKGIDWIIKYKLQNIFRERCQQIVKDTNGMGWGFHDGLKGIYSKFF